MKNLFIKIFSIVLLISIGFSSVAQDVKKEISLVDLWARYYYFPQAIQEIKSMNDGEHYCVLENNEIIKYSYKNGQKVGKVLESRAFAEKMIEVSAYEFSADESKILLVTEKEMIYRHSFNANYFIWDIKKKELKALSENGKQRLATFSPNGSKVAFVRDNHIFITDLIKGNEYKITKDGKENEIINGAPDWVYEEEFSFSKGFEWAPDGKKIAYMKFDESNVKEFTINYYGKLYPEKHDYKYPKAGEDNSLVNVFCYNLESNETRKMDTGKETDQYIPRIKWTNDPNLLSIQRLNRLQNKFELLLTDAITGTNKIAYSETSKYYIDIFDNLHFLKDNKSFIITSEKDGFNHIYHYGFDGKEIKQLTKGKWDVIESNGVDENNGLVYYISAEISPMDRDIYSVSLNGKKKNKISTRKGTNIANFSTGFKYYINEFSDANTPSIYTINDPEGKELITLKDNEILAKKVKNLPKKEFFTFKTEDNIELNGWMIKPPSFDSKKKHPVFMTVYGGPGSQTVENGWIRIFDDIWYKMLAQKGYIVVSVDNRGTGARGEEFKKCTYKELGKHETIDQINAAKYLGGLQYVDKDRIGIFGWSYGGYMSTLCMTKGADYFKTGIAVAPVTNWRYYDNIYTERFMRTPQENASGYDDNSPINHVAKLKGNYLLIHGDADDNVHVQNSMDLITALVAQNKQFDYMVYPNCNHGIFGGNTRYHLYKKMTDFILENL